MHEPIAGDSEQPPDFPDRPEWRTVAVRIGVVLVVVLLAILLIRFLRRGGAAVALAAAAPVAAATLLKAPSITKVRTRPHVDQDFLRAVLR